MKALEPAAALMLIVAGLGAQTGIALEHRRGAETLAEGRLDISERAWSGRSEDGTFVIEGEVEVSESGLVRRYRREVRRKDPDRLVSRVVLTASDGGYDLTEHNGIAPRHLRLEVAPVHLVVDGSWPEAMIPPLLGRDGGHLRVLLLASHAVHFASLLPREEGARHLALPGGGVTLRRAADGTFAGLRVPGETPVEIVPRTAARADTGPASPPPGVREEALAVPLGAASLAGRLALPAAGEGPWPAVLLIPDEGERDLDGALPGVGRGLLADLAHELAQHGYASLRFEKPREITGLATLKDAARAAALALRERAETRAAPIAVCGHGEGATIAAEIARERPELFAAVIGLAAPPRSVDHLLRQRLRVRLTEQGAPPERVAEQEAALKEELAALRATEDPENLDPDRRLLFDLLGLNPLETLQRLEVPFLLVYGERDPDVPAEFRAVHRTALALGARVSYKFQVLGAADHEFLQVGILRPGAEKVFVGVDVERPRHPALSLFVRDFLDGISKPEAEKR